MSWKNPDVNECGQCLSCLVRVGVCLPSVVAVSCMARTAPLLLPTALLVGPTGIHSAKGIKMRVWSKETLKCEFWEKRALKYTFKKKHELHGGLSWDWMLWRGPGLVWILWSGSWVVPLRSDLEGPTPRWLYQPRPSHAVKSKSSANRHPDHWVQPQKYNLWDDFRLANGAQVNENEGNSYTLCSPKTKRCM